MKKALLFCFLLFLPVISVMAGDGKVRKSANAIRDEYIVVLHDRTRPEEVADVAQRVAKAHGATVKKVWQHALKGFFATMPAARAEALSRHPDVAFVEENGQVFDSATVPTRIDPALDPGQQNYNVTDNRLWHLDVLDQNSAVATNSYSYCTNDTSVTVYVVDSGVMRAHREFSDNPARVVDGHDATGDPAGFPAWNPCGGPAHANMHDAAAVSANLGHGTGVASLVGGRNVGVARNVTIVPIKTTPCAFAGAMDVQPETAYTLNQIVFADLTYYKVTTAGSTGVAATRPAEWAAYDDPDPTTQWGTAVFRYLGPLLKASEKQMLIDGTNWILSPSNPHPKSPAVVTFSKYFVAIDEPAKTTALETAVMNLLKYKEHSEEEIPKGITVIASANNQDADACDTTPARLSRNAPNHLADPYGYRVITVGGTMLRNNPDPNPDATGNGDGGEPTYDPTKETVQGRWVCGAGDSDLCSKIRRLPSFPEGYSGMTMGSNGGQCVTLFAPAKNIPVASLAAINGYRNPRATNTGASGTSWSAPIVAGMAARILQSHPAYTVDEVYLALMSRSPLDLSLEQLNPPNVTGTPRNVLRMTDVLLGTDLPALTAAAASGPTTIALTSVVGTAPLTYELYRVNANFDVGTYPRHAEKSTLVGSPQSSGTFSVANALGHSYFIRVKGSCGSADSRITTVVTGTAPAPPSNFTATRGSGSVAFTWSPVTNADGYRVERKIPGQPWMITVTVSGQSASSASEPAPPTPGGVVLYRVTATSGGLVSAPSNVDVAWVGTFTDDGLVIGSTLVRAIHVLELRKAVNSLCAAADLAPQFSAAEVADDALSGSVFEEEHLTDLMDRLNTARTSIGMGSVAFGETPVPWTLNRAAATNDLRAGVK
ncbi:MAG TPA: S8 family serine peptidase [Thermoanaerobaculia bacterium]|nr:S8 family serine peptidase [Thermoanaerobaculia bacterium]